MTWCPGLGHPRHPYRRSLGRTRTDREKADHLDELLSRAWPAQRPLSNGTSKSCQTSSDSAFGVNTEGMRNPSALELHRGVHYRKQLPNAQSGD